MAPPRPGCPLRSGSKGEGVALSKAFVIRHLWGQEYYCTSWEILQILVARSSLQQSSTRKVYDMLDETEPHLNLNEFRLDSHTVAKRLGKDERTVRYYAHLGIIPGVKPGGPRSHWRFRDKDIDDHIRDRLGSNR